MREEFYNKVYPRQPQLLKRLTPLFNELEIIEEKTQHLSNKNNERQLKRKLNKFKEKRKPKVKLVQKKISEVRPDILYGLR